MLERIEIDDDQVDGVDAMRRHGGFIVFVSTARKDATVNFWMQGFDPAPHDFGKPGMLGHVGDRNAGVT